MYVKQCGVAILRTVKWTAQKLMSNFGSAPLRGFVF